MKKNKKYSHIVGEYSLSFNSFNNYINLPLDSLTADEGRILFKLL